MNEAQLKRGKGFLWTALTVFRSERNHIPQTSDFAQFHEKQALQASTAIPAMAVQ